MYLTGQIIFLIVTITAAVLFFSRLLTIRKNVLKGRSINLSDQPARRWKNMFLYALGQKKMFKRVTPAILHLMVYAGFLIINIEGIEIIIDGLFGTHRIFAPYLGNFYTFTINFFEIMALAVILSSIIFLIRRNILNVPRFSGLEMTRWPKLDANLILIFEIVLMLAILTMHATDQVLQDRNTGYPETGRIFFSSMFIPWLDGMETNQLIWLERASWWIHVVGIYAFAIYVTYSKHLHTFLSFPNTYYAPLAPMGKMRNMDEVTSEVKYMMGQSESNPPEAGPELSRLGARDVTDLTWKNLLDAYTCTECGRCTAQCPANITGKKLSPRKIMMDTRDRLEELGQDKKGEKAEHVLLENFITKEEINACTTCNACVEACPVNINPLSIILQLRRYVALEESGSPQEWNQMFSNIENNFAPWQFPPAERFAWAREINHKENKAN